MFERDPVVPKTDRRLPPASPVPNPEVPRQHRLMVGALLLLLGALGMLLYNDRDFWFPGTLEAEDQPVQALPVPAADTVANQPLASTKKQRPTKSRTPKAKAKEPVATEPSAQPLASISDRTVLPPVDVEVIAGDRHQRIRPGSNAVRVDMQPGSPPQSLADPSPAEDETAERITSNAAENVQMSTDTAGIISGSVKPSYPLLARQMKVQGSVILQALIGRDGMIQDLRVLSGPPILANAAQEAIKQWRFRPHYKGTDAVETQANITVNFTISTN